MILLSALWEYYCLAPIFISSMKIMKDWNFVFFFFLDFLHTLTKKHQQIKDNHHCQIKYLFKFILLEGIYASGRHFLGEMNSSFLLPEETEGELTP